MKKQCKCCGTTKSQKKFEIYKRSKFCKSCYQHISFFAMSDMIIRNKTRSTKHYMKMCSDIHD